MYDKVLEENSASNDECNETDNDISFCLQEKLKSPKYDGRFVRDLDGVNFSFKLLQDVGLLDPIRIKQKSDLGVIVPENSCFGVSDIRALVGGRRIVDVIETKSNRHCEMSIREYEQYYEDKDRTYLYNVISLEFSKSKLDYVVQRPAIVDSLDWVDLVWPQHLKSMPAGSSKPFYPKVQKYCFISVAGCYTDFHIDFGGSTSWYHAFKGENVFWLIPPTSQNLKLYEHCINEDNMREVFFGDVVSKCQCITLEQGSSLVIPSGWIYAVYASKDSIMFGGNFLNSFSIPMQICIYELEKKLNVPDDFQFPYFIEIHWHALERYVHILTGKSYLSESLQSRYSIKTKTKPSPEVEDEGTKNPVDHVHLTPFEYKGLVILIDMLENLPMYNKSVPEDIFEPNELLKAGKDLLIKHSSDDPVLAATGKPKAFWPVPLHCNTLKKVKPKPKIVKQVLVPKKGPSSRVRRVRCKECEACLRDDCKECVFCRDMRKHGGPGTMKQTCIKRRCINPILPSTASVSVVQNVQITAANLPTQIETQPPKKEKRPVESNEEFVPAKIQKLEAEECFDDDYIEDVEYSFMRPVQPVVTRIPWKDLLKYSVRPAPSTESKSLNQSKSEVDVWTNVFKYISKKDLINCMMVSKDFLRKAGSPKLWRKIDLTARRLKPSLLQFLVRRAPVELDLSHSNIGYKQLLWLLERLPSLRKLLLVGCSWSTAAALASASCPPLHTVDLSWASGFSDPHLSHLISVPKDARPGQEITHTRLYFCRELKLSGTEITDKALKLISQRLPLLRMLDVSYCSITNDGVGYLTNLNSSKTKLLSVIVAQYCRNLSDNVFTHLGKLPEITEVDFRHCQKVSDAACLDFINVCKSPVKRIESLHIVACV